jgi:hypothetical protein
VWWTVHLPHRLFTCVSLCSILTYPTWLLVISFTLWCDNHSAPVSWSEPDPYTPSVTYTSDTEQVWWRVSLHCDYEQDICSRERGFETSEIDGFIFPLLRLQIASVLTNKMAFRTSCITCSCSVQFDVRFLNHCRYLETVIKNRKIIMLN